MRWGLLFLNNRNHDPTLGTFISVDPLVNVTGEPYIYAGGNPTTLSDPTGLYKAGEDPDDCRGGRRCGGPSGDRIPDGYFFGSKGGHGSGGPVADSLTGSDIGDFTDFIVDVSRQFEVDPALILALGLIEQGYSGLCRGCAAAVEKSVGSHTSYFDTHGLTNVSEEVFLSVMSGHRDELSEFVPDGWQDRSDHDIWRSLGEPALDELTIAVTIAHVRDRVDFVRSLGIDAGLGVSANEFAALSWNFSLQPTVERIATGQQPFGLQTTDYVETLRSNYWGPAMLTVCPAVTACDFGPTPLAAT